MPNSVPKIGPTLSRSRSCLRESTQSFGRHRHLESLLLSSAESTRFQNVLKRLSVGPTTQRDHHSVRAHRVTAIGMAWVRASWGRTVASERAFLISSVGGRHAFAPMDLSNAESIFIGSNNRIPGAASECAGATINRLPSLAPPAGMQLRGSNPTKIAASVKCVA